MTFEFVDVTCAILIPGILLASWYDFAQRRVPNWLNLALILIGFAVQACFFGWSGLSFGLMGMLTGFGLLIVPWLMHGMGAGDVKLMAAIGAWFGPAMTMWSFVAGALMGGVIAVVMIVAARKLKHAGANLTTIMIKLSNPTLWFTEMGGTKSFGATSQLLPYGIPLTMGSITVLLGITLKWWSI